MVDRLAAILRRNAPRSVTVLRMEVPCCGALERVLLAAVRQAGATTPLETVVIGRRGEVSSQQPLRQET